MLLVDGYRSSLSEDSFHIIQHVSMNIERQAQRQPPFAGHPRKATDMGFFDFFKSKRATASNPPRDLYGGGNGQSEEEAVVIRTTSSSIGVPAEYAWLEKQYGLRDSDWSINLRMHGPDATGRIHEKFHIKLTDGTEKTIYFDISSFFGRP